MNPLCLNTSFLWGQLYHFYRLELCHIISSPTLGGLSWGSGHISRHVIGASIFAHTRITIHSFNFNTDTHILNRQCPTICSMSFSQS